MSTNPEQDEPQTHSSEVLGSTVNAGEMWALLTDTSVQDLCPTADGVIAELGARLHKDDEWTRRFMEQNGWLLVRVQTTHKIVAVLKTLNERVSPRPESQ
jgi:hypothetical protein